MELFTNIKRSKNAGVELKDYGIAKGMDGQIWSADLHFNGKKVGQLVDEGLDSVATDIPGEVVSAIVASLKATEYVLDADMIGNTPVQTNEFAYFECATSCMAIEVAELDALKKATKKTTHFVRTDGKTYVMKFPFDAETAELIRKTEGDRLVCIINEELAAL